MKLTAMNSVINIPVKKYRIGELVRHTPFSRQTLHNYTIMGLISETEWTQGGHRLYDESVFNRLAKINDLRKTKTLSQIQKILALEETSKNFSQVNNKNITNHINNNPTSDF
jgi:DNA-binding transcriptional MerR regulator